MLKNIFSLICFLNKMQLFVRIRLYATNRNHFFLFKVMFNKNLFFPKTKTVKIGLGGVCQTFLAKQGLNL
jgi:hypothetical protein